MGANGTFSKGKVIPLDQREYEAVCKIADNIFVLQKKKGANKLPEESHTPGRIYVIFRKDGKDVKGIGLYGSDHKKVWDIHLQDHNGMNPHVHYWQDGTRVAVRALTDEQQKLLDKIRNLNP